MRRRPAARIYDAQPQPADETDDHPRQRGDDQQEEVATPFVTDRQRAGDQVVRGVLVQPIVVGLLAAYIAGRALGPGAHYLQVFRFVGASSFMGYSLALAQHSIWYGRNWGTTLRSMVDGLVYALLTAGTFGWLWPR